MKSYAVILLATTSFFCLPVANFQTASAQPSDGADEPVVVNETGGSEEAEQSRSLLLQSVTVTANKREENLQDVGIAVTAFNEEAINKLGFSTATDFTALAPSVSFYQFSPSVSNINIRGVVQNDFADHLEPPIAVYQDEGYVGTSGGISVPIFDLERVEVLRGPQGTLFGRNATGGLIHFVSAEPTEEFEGYAKAELSSFNTVNLQGAVSGPFAEGVRGRLAFTYNDGDSPFENVVTGERDAGDTDNYAVRGQLAFDLSDRTELRLLGKYYRDDSSGPMYSIGVTNQGSDGLGVPVSPGQAATFANIVTGGGVPSACAGCNVVGYVDSDGDPWTASSSYPGYFERDISGAQARLVHEFDSFTLTSITDYLQVDKDILYDTDGSPAQFFIYGTTQDYDQFSQEIRFDGASGPLTWVAGGYYLDMDGDYGSTVDLDLSPYVGAPICEGAACPIGGNVPAHFQTDYSLGVESWAVFAQGEWEFTPQLSGIFGIRYTADEKTYDYAFSNTPVLQPDFTYNTKNNPNASDEFENVSIKAQLEWRPITDTLIYLGYSRGHKGGNWTAPVFPPIFPGTFNHDQEVLNSYETGLKTRFWDGRAIFNASVFYYDYEDYQAFSLINIAQSIFNADATVQGAEAELRLNPIDPVDLSFTAATVSSEVNDIVLPDGSVVKRDLPNTPELELTGLARYTWDAFGGEASAQVTGQYKSDYYLTVLNEPVNKEGSWATLDGRLAWISPDQSLELAVFGKNLTETEYRVWALDVSILSLGMQVYAPPRTFGASIRCNF
tara:strand:- start:7174 stop:9522 length:2349 start_codon:yes stop_codon:yes gene_type:complete